MPRANRARGRPSGAFEPRRRQPDGRLWARFEELGRSPLRSAREASPRVCCSRRRPGWSPWPAVDDGTASEPVTAFRIGLDIVSARLAARARRHVVARARPPGPGAARTRAVARLKAPERRRLEWLLGRIAAKDAVRDYLHRRFHLSFVRLTSRSCPTPSGRPVVAGAWTARCRACRSSRSRMSTAPPWRCSTDGDGISGVGIDLERCGRMTPDMEDVAFTAASATCSTVSTATTSTAWALRLWCAKEALAKATGGAVSPVSVGSRRSNEIHHDDGRRGMRYAHAERPAARLLSASTAREGDWIVATCIR